MSEHNTQQAQEIVSANLAAFHTLTGTEATALEVYHVEDGPESAGKDVIIAFVKNAAEGKNYKLEINTSSKTVLGAQPLILLDWMISIRMNSFWFVYWLGGLRLMIG